MKKLISALMAAALLLSLIGCKGEPSDQTSEREKKKKSSVTTELTQPQPMQSSTNITAEPTQPEVPPKKQLDPFEGLKFEVTGISPFCKIAINNAECSSDVQLHVSYTLDKEYYANGEEAVLTASVDRADEYELVSQTGTCKVENQPEYITSLEGLDLTFLESELDDYVAAETSAAIGKAGIMGCYFGGFTIKTIDSVTHNETWFETIKLTKLSPEADFYNALNYMYTIKCTILKESATVYANVSCCNIVKYPDGSLKWGKSNPDTYGFSASATDVGFDSLIATTVTVHASDYNLTKVFPK